MLTARLWFARLVALYALLIFCFLSYLYLVEPLDHIARFGISASGAPESVTFLRTAPGAMFLAMAIFAATGLARPRLLATALWGLVIVDGCVVAARLAGIGVDGVTPMQLSELQDEGVSWLLFVAALAAHPRGRTSA